MQPKILCASAFNLSQLPKGTPRLTRLILIDSLFLIEFRSQFLIVISLISSCAAAANCLLNLCRRLRRHRRCRWWTGWMSPPPTGEEAPGAPGRTPASPAGSRQPNLKKLAYYLFSWQFRFELIYIIWHLTMIGKLMYNVCTMYSTCMSSEYI